MIGSPSFTIESCRTLPTWTWTLVLSAFSPGGRNSVMRYLRAVFFFGVRHGYLGENPITRLEFAERKRKEVETIPADKVEAMLNHSLEHDLKLLPYLVFGFFAGIRPDGEFQKVEWADVKLSENAIVIRPEVSKTNRRRFPKLCENATAWLEVYGQRGGSFAGSVAIFEIASCGYIAWQTGRRRASRNGCNRGCGTRFAQIGSLSIKTLMNWCCNAATIQLIPCGAIITRASQKPRR